VLHHLTALHPAQTLPVTSAQLPVAAMLNGTAAVSMWRDGPYSLTARQVLTAWTTSGDWVTGLPTMAAALVLPFSANALAVLSPFPIDIATEPWVVVVAGNGSVASVFINATTMSMVASVNVATYTTSVTTDAHVSADSGGGGRFVLTYYDVDPQSAALSLRVVPGQVGTGSSQGWGDGTVTLGPATTFATDHETHTLTNAGAALTT